MSDHSNGSAYSRSCQSVRGVINQWVTFGVKIMLDGIHGEDPTQKAIFLPHAQKSCLLVCMLYVPLDPSGCCSDKGGVWLLEGVTNSDRSCARVNNECDSMICTNVLHTNDALSTLWCKILTDTLQVWMIRSVVKLGKISWELRTQNVHLACVSSVRKETVFNQLGELMHMLIIEPVIRQVSSNHGNEAVSR